jgi:hypothetical protein
MSCCQCTSAEGHNVVVVAVAVDAVVSVALAVDAVVSVSVAVDAVVVVAAVEAAAAAAAVAVVSVVLSTCLDRGGCRCACTTYRVCHMWKGLVWLSVVRRELFKRRG